MQKIFAALDHPGEETRVVGGAVRDALYGRAVREIDLAATAPPRATLERAAAAGLRALPTGFAHGTVTILVDGESFEVTTLREDVETDGRRARVRFGRDFAADAARRDFTINALSLSRDGALHDYVGGLDDAAARRVRFIGDPDRRIAEDFLRILRFFRFSADYADTIDAAGFWACARQRAGVERLSRERLRAELMKTLHSRRAAPALAAMGETGALGAILGGVVNPARLARLIESAPDACALLRLAALALDAQEDAARLAARLRLSTAERDRRARAGAALAVFHARR
ncbi:CCA tRNA nucleotidyltransferase, partial [Methylocella sp.]|uniref:CCA tRNA nucleotidyltransferase n=1 Tax=Methylocella sp. TaxID=1978226 RepID=UPI003783ABDC